MLAVREKLYSPTPLPVHVNWPLLIAFITNRMQIQDLAKQLKVSRGSIEGYLSGRTTAPRFHNGVEYLRRSSLLTDHELHQVVEMESLPVLPPCVDWNGLSRALGASFGRGEMKKQLPKEEYEAYVAACRHYRKKRIRPMWPTGAILLNLAQDRLNGTQYRLLTNAEKLKDQ